MAIPLHLLILEDQQDDAKLMVHKLRQAGFELTWQQVETEQDYLAHLDLTLDVILADYTLPQFDALRALHILQERKLDIPFIVVTGTISEEVAVECMKQGAADYLHKDRLARLGQAVTNALHEKKLRYEKRQAEESLREREEMWRRYEFIVNASGELMSLINRDYIYEAVNESYCRSQNLEREDIIGRSVAELWSEEVFNNVIKGYLDRCFADEEVRYQTWFEFGALGSRCFEVIYYPYRDQQNTVTHVVVVSRDITELRRTLEATISSLASALAMRDPYTADHQRKVTKLACAIANEMTLSDKQIDGIRLAALAHDIGKIYVPAEILSKPGRLTDIEFSMIKTHSQVGYDILEPIKFPWPIAQIVLQHHEKINGSGYPQGLSGEDILIEAKIITVADVVDAMSSHRPYRPALDKKVTISEISQKKGILYEPEVVDACLKLLAEGRFELE